MKFGINITDAHQIDSDLWTIEIFEMFKKQIFHSFQEERVSWATAISAGKEDEIRKQSSDEAGAHICVVP